MKSAQNTNKLRIFNAPALLCGLLAFGFSPVFADPVQYDFHAEFGYNAIHTAGDVTNNDLRRYGGSGTGLVFATEDDPVGILFKGGNQGYKRYSFGTADKAVDGVTDISYHWQDSQTPVSYTINALSFTTNETGTQALNIVLFGNGVTYNGNGAEYASPNVLGLYITMLNPTASETPGKAGFKVDVRYKINDAGKSFGGSPSVSLGSYTYNSADFSGTFGFTIDQTNTLKVILNGVTEETGITLTSDIMDAFSDNCDFGVVLMGGSATSDVQFRMGSLSIKSAPIPEPALLSFCLGIIAVIALGYRKIPR
ncbi:hypothetical protein OpiT1DRAFT_01116 [Opitutaceae bacterium TAV1]|nr:hypothetical protein OpiT1DRAFT_01116 [Opitutaceae bacterium TAV1]